MRRTAALAIVLGVALTPTVARADKTQESIFQDDNHLLYAPTATVNQTLGTLQALGVDRVRLSILWSAIAPDPKSRTPPANFDATNPADYPAANWAPYDRVIELAAAHGIGVDFDVTAPGPLWAMGQGAPSAAAENHYAPSAADWADFVAALGKRYSGTYQVTTGSPAPPAPGPLPITITPPPPSTPSTTTLPRVHYWEIWNEPNIPGWLAPQSRTVNGKQVENSPRLYREYVDAAYGALYATGHVVPRDTILIGDLAPEGFNNLAWYTEMTPMRFLRALYCVGSTYRPLRGTRAQALGCPTSGGAATFASDHPGLFQASGFAHHPYYFFFPPAYSATNPNFVPLANLARLERGLNRSFRAYGVKRQIPIYLTEYGYQTNPPDPYEVVTPAEQAAYLNQADYLAWRDPRVRSVSQFLLYDAGPNPSYAPSSFDYWDTFQTGLLYASGARKPAFASYPIPIWLPIRRVPRRGRLLVWGQLRAAANGTAQHAELQWRPKHGRAYRTIAQIHVAASDPEAYFTVRVRPLRSGAVRIVWGALRSRAVAVKVR